MIPQTSVQSTRSGAQSYHRRTATPSMPREFLSFRLGAEEYAVETECVIEVSRYSEKLQSQPVSGYRTGVTNFRGAAVPIIDARLRFGLAPFTRDSAIVIIYLNHGACTTGLLVDAFSGVVDLAGDEIAPGGECSVAIATRHITGTATLCTRKLLLIDVEALVGGS